MILVCHHYEETLDTEAVTNDGEDEKRGFEIRRFLAKLCNTYV